MHRYKSHNLKFRRMKKLLFIISLVGLFSLTSCGAQEECRGRTDIQKVQQQPTKMLAVNYTKDNK